MDEIWKDGIMLMLRLSNLASQQGERVVALSLLVTSIEAMKQAKP